MEDMMEESEESVEMLKYCNQRCNMSHSPTTPKQSSFGTAIWLLIQRIPLQTIIGVQW